MELLQDTDDGVRFSAVLALQRLRAPGAAPRLLEVLSAGEPWAAAMAAHALGHQRCEQGTAAIAAELARADDDLMRIQCLRGLGASGDTNVAGEILTTAMSGSWEVRWAAAQALDELRRPEATAVVAMLIDDEAVSPAEKSHLRRWHARLRRRRGPASNGDP